MRGLAKQSRHIMFTEKQLVEFGNYLLKTYDVQVHSSDGKNQPIYQREVSDADFCNWMATQPVGSTPFLPLPSRFQHGDKAVFICMPDDAGFSTFPGIPCEILAVHFYSGKVKYDLDLLFVENQRSRIYNVDSVLVEERKVPVGVNIRNRMDLWKPSELAIYNAIQEIEKMDADVRLTNAQILLQQAKDLVADFIIEKEK